VGFEYPFTRERANKEMDQEWASEE
jgi:hypothetical protein